MELMLLAEKMGSVRFEPIAVLFWSSRSFRSTHERLEGSRRTVERNSVNWAKVLLYANFH